MVLRLFATVVSMASLLPLACDTALAQPGPPANSHFARRFPVTQVDEARVRAAGIRKLESRRLVLYTDLAAAEVDELPQIFDQAFDLWCKYFKLDSSRFSDWRMRASLIDKLERFKAAGLIPADLPNFLNGYTLNLECWLHNQSSPYYRRHLLLHEGVHGFMFTLLGNNTPPWYAEGMAEYLGTHRWQDGKLELPYYPRDTNEVTRLGRIEIVQSDFAQARGPQFANVMAYDNKAHINVEPYGWSWAAVAFLDGHPKYRDTFRKLIKLLPTDTDFNSEFRKRFGPDFARLTEEWQVFAANIDYGYDFDKTVIDFKPGKPLTDNKGNATVQADRGWQNSGFRLEGNHHYQISAKGKYQIANEGLPWMSEPQGISIRYIQGRPLGQLLAVIRPDRPSNGKAAFLNPISIGSAAKITPTETGTLYFKVNDSAGSLSDNHGQADVEIRAE